MTDRERYGEMPPLTAYDFHLESIRKGTLRLSDFKGKALLIVNTASKCVFTRQYDGLQSLWSLYRDWGLVVIGIPSNDFGRQEPGSNEEISHLCRQSFGVSFPLASKSHVRGNKAIPIFRWLTEQGGYFSHPRWNFYKYVIGRDGLLRNWFPSIIRPECHLLIRSIERTILE